MYVSSAWHNLKKMENAMTTTYISVEPDGSVKTFMAKNLIDATEQYYKRGCCGEIHLKIPFERQPLIWRKTSWDMSKKLLGHKPSA